VDIKTFVEQNLLLNMSGFVNPAMYYKQFPEHEVMEVWAVTDPLAHRLLAKGEAVLKIGAAHVWGRCCSGQAVKMDSVIQEIFDELPRFPD
jgi:hypothetical protein